MIPLTKRRNAASTPRAAGLAGCIVCGALLLAAAAGCGGSDRPSVQVVNHSGLTLDDLWVHTQGDSVRVPRLEPGGRADVRPRVRGEDLLWVGGRFDGRPVSSHGGDYVERSGGYRFRATVDSSGHIDVRFVRLGLW